MLIPVTKGRVGSSEAGLSNSRRPTRRRRRRGWTVQGRVVRAAGGVQGRKLGPAAAARGVQGRKLGTASSAGCVQGRVFGPNTSAAGCVQGRVVHAGCLEGRVGGREAPERGRGVQG